jgi:RNA polymerase-binding transcription factor DksA
MAKKPAPKKKPAAKKPTAKKPVAKKVTKPASKKVVKPAAKKPAAKKPVAKKVTKPAPKKQVKKAVKPAPKKVVKKVEKKKSTKIVVKKNEKKIAKVTPKKVEKVKLKKVKEEKVSKRTPMPTVIPELKLKIVKKVGKQPLKRSTLDVSRNRYSDKELNEFKDLINEKLGKAKQELHYIQEQITKAAENGTADTENRFGGMEDGAGTLEREYLNQMASRAGSYIEHLEKALMRIENKTYGICTVTGKLISKERLRAVPHATKSLEAKEMGKG